MSDCMCRECLQWRAHVAAVRSIKAEIDAARGGPPTYDWPALEAEDRRSREDPAWYKRKGARP